jgi:hypothetical protein
VLALYRLRWRIELAFKRLKSLIGLKEPPGFDEGSAKPWILAHLLLALLIEPLADGLDEPLRWPLDAARPLAPLRSTGIPQPTLRALLCHGGKPIA